ncbi:acyl-CoA synthetase (NDP forming type) [Rhodococcus wratislaviensis]|uniref:Acyl-CoA synthetase (NDP forming type) n=1 Tax=Rhodococcus wratislaviensis TaxID=44752 RepID=A0A402CJ92_RHOWR|nr:GNAT family N-acetyltransferase [Rhodococcus wratislaviensis]GCE43638.1 acyl-CoA synthetase (NDP forming type) [Rhodococcus wratislaviensis]
MVSTFSRSPAGLVVRPLRTADHEAVRRLHERLNAYDTYMRFFTVCPAHLAALAEAICVADPRHYGLGAFVDGTLVGVANYVALDAGDASEEVEFALVVDDDYRMHGIGTMLLTRLAAAARQRGVTRMRAEILAQNAMVLQVIRDLGWSAALHRDRAEMHLDLDLGDVPSSAVAGG